MNSSTVLSFVNRLERDKSRRLYGGVHFRMDDRTGNKIVHSLHFRISSVDDITRVSRYHTSVMWEGPEKPSITLYSFLIHLLVDGHVVWSER